MARVRKGDRAKTRKRTGSSKFPMETGAQVNSAIRLRGHSKRTPDGPAVGSDAVLKRASSAVSRLQKSGKMSEATAKRLKNKIAKARKGK
ncbi:MAG: hypothetical protein ABIH46_08900 [Chloroflexota bacterium]